MAGPSRHITWEELACWNRLGRVFAVAGKTYAPGEAIAPYPMAWRDTRAVLLADTFEAVRELLGGKPIAINSAYRTDQYNKAVGGAPASQHVQGRALDIVHPTLPAREVFVRLKEAQAGGALEHLGGLGSYKTFVHMDVRPKVGGRLAVWIL